MFAVTPTVTVVALGSATGAEWRSQTAQVAIDRAAGAATSKSLTVHYALTGTATNGVDYTTLSGTAVIPAGRLYTTVTVVPLRDTLIEGNETVVFSLVADPAYAVAPSDTAMLTIIDYPVNTDWRAAPFRTAYKDTIFQNQYGTAELTDQALSSFNGYGIFYDDGGPITVTTTGTLATDLAYYEQVGQPLTVDDTGGTSNTTSVTGSVTAQKNIDYIAVRPHTAGETGTFDLTVSGPPEGVPYPLSISSSSGAGSSGSDISGTYDIDYYRFRVPRNGNYLIQAVPTSKNLDVEMNVYDNAGNPIGGTYTSAINNGGPGVTENFTAVGLQGGQIYWMRVNGVNNQAGDYGVSVQIQPNIPDVSVVATVPTAKAGADGKLTVSRSYASPSPLTIQYRVRGLAVAGTDYQALTGTITIPANATSATINVVPLDASGKSFVLSLYAGTAYNLTSKASAVVTIG